MVTIDIQGGGPIEVCLYNGPKQKGQSHRVAWRSSFDESVQQALMKAINDLIALAGDVIVNIGIALEVELEKHHLRYDSEQRCVCTS